MSNDTLCMGTSEHIYDYVLINHQKYEFQFTVPQLEAEIILYNSNWAAKETVSGDFY